MYALLSFFKNLLKEFPFTSNIEKLVISKLNIDINTNLKQSVTLKEFQKLFESCLGKDNCRLIFDLVPKDEFYNKYFGKLIYIEEDPHNNFCG